MFRHRFGIKHLRLIVCLLRCQRMSAKAGAATFGSIRILKERRQIVEDPSGLLGLSFADAFGIGVATWSIIDVATAVLLPFLPLSGGLAGLILFWSHKFIYRPLSLSSLLARSGSAFGGVRLHRC